MGFEEIRSETEIIKDKLKKYKIPIETWGEVTTKTIDDLYEEIKEGETELIEENREIFRKVNMVTIDIYYTDKNGKKYHLKEDRQVFKDGSVREREYIKESVSEKRKKDEVIEDVVVRGVKEELGIDGNLDVEFIDSRENVRESNSYPGLKSKYIFDNYKVEISDKEYKTEGYKEEQENKTNYFVWEEVK